MGLKASVANLSKNVTLLFPHTTKAGRRWGKRRKTLKRSSSIYKKYKYYSQPKKALGILERKASGEIFTESGYTDASLTADQGGRPTSALKGPGV